MFCPNCGDNFEGEAGFCPTCGAQIGGAQPQMMNQQMAQPQMNNMQMNGMPMYAQPNNKKKIGIIAGIAVAVVAVIVIVCLFVFGPLGKDGTYKLYQITEDGETISYDAYRKQMRSEYGFDMGDMSIKIKGSKATISAMGQEQTGKVKWSGNKCKITIDGETQVFKYSNGKLIMEEDGSKMVFKK